MSALPTLAPGQSGQVTVRFDPSESGNFTGNVQVGIHGGQGSVTSPPLVGTAHKIEVNPAELDFGLALVGSSPRKKTVIVKNQGVTTVTLQTLVYTPETLPLFRVTLQLMQIGPGESTNVDIEFLPNASGIFSGKLGLAGIGSSILEISVIGRVYTEEEFSAWLQRQRQTYREICQAVETVGHSTPGMHIPRGDLDIILYGFMCLEEEKFKEVIRFIMSDEWQSFELPPTLEDNINNIPIGPWDVQHFLQALQFLANAQNFDQAFDSAYGAGHYFSPTFQTFVDTLNLMNLALIVGRYPIPFSLDFVLGNRPAKQAVRYSVYMLQYDSTLSNTLEVLLRNWPVPSFIPVGGIYISACLMSADACQALQQITILYVIARVVALSYTESYIANGLTQNLVAEFIKAMADMSTRDDSFAKDIVSYLLANVLALQGRPFYIFSPENFANTVAQIIALGSLVRTSWTILAFNIPGDSDTHLVATRVINGIPTAAFIHVQAKLGPSEVNRVAQILLDIARLAALSTDPSITPPLDPRTAGHSGVVVLITYQSDQDTVDKLVRILQASSPPVPIVIIWIDSQNIIHATGVCGQSGCPGGMSAQEYANRIAKALGLIPGQRFGSPSSSYVYLIPADEEQAVSWVCDDECLQDLMHWWWAYHMR